MLANAILSLFIFHLEIFDSVTFCVNFLSSYHNLGDIFQQPLQEANGCLFPELAKQSSLFKLFLSISYGIFTIIGQLITCCYHGVCFKYLGGQLYSLDYRNCKLINVTLGPQITKTSFCTCTFCECKSN